MQTWGGKVFRKMLQFHLGYRGWHLRVVMNEICLKSASVKYFYGKKVPFSAKYTRGTSAFTKQLSCDLWEREMCVEEFVYSASPNLVLIAWDGFPLPFSHFLPSLPRSLFSLTWLKKCLYINHSGFVPVFIKQIIWCHTYLCSWKVCTQLPTAIPVA